MKRQDTKAVLLDLDGTLVDSAPDLAASVNHALRNCNLNKVDNTKVRSFIGNGAERLLHRAITGERDGVAPMPVFECVRRVFFEHYADNVCKHSVPYPGVHPTLDELRDRGHLFACVTNKPKRFTEPLLDALGLTEYFSIVLSGDSLEKKKPAADQLLHAARHCAIEIDRCVMIGDTLTDMDAAANCRMRGIFVSYGYGSIDDLGPTFDGPVVDSFEQLIDIL